MARQIYMGPSVTPGVTELVARVATWTAVLARLDAANSAPYVLRPNTMLTDRIRAAIAGRDSTDAVQVTLPDDMARVVMGMGAA